MPKSFRASALKFADDIVDSEYGKKSHRLDLFHNDLWVGYVDYSEYRGQPTIHYVGVPEIADRRRGFATLLVQRVQQNYPGRQIAWLGTATREGASFYAALPKIERQVKSVIDQQRHLATLVRQRDAMLLANSGQLSSRSLRELNELHDNISDLEVSLGGKSTVCILVDLTDAVPFPGPTISA